MPSPRFTAEEEIYREILAVAAQENVPTVVYRDDLFLTEEISVSLFSAWGDPQFLFTVADVSVSYGIATEAQGASDVCVLGCYGAEERPLSPRPMLSADTKLLSPSPSALPFDDPRGVLFAKEYRVLIPYAE